MGTNKSDSGFRVIQTASKFDKVLFFIYTKKHLNVRGTDGERYAWVQNS